MTYTLNLTPEQRHHYHEADREWLAEAPPLPSAEDLARPIIDGLSRLHDAFHGRASAMEYHVDSGDFLSEATELVATAERVAALLRTEIGGMLAGEFRGWQPVDMDDVVRAITQSPYVESTLNRKAMWGT